ncbi:sugar kinase [Labedella endophytica]|nr:sugar kinase [Labedella endophytica]
MTDVLCIGEAMVLGVGADGDRLASAETVHLHVAGAEANVASGLAALGVPVEWWSRVGRDPFGERVVGELARRGVSCVDVARDADRPTGVYFKDSVGSRTSVHYYRAGSAASAMSTRDLPSLRLQERRLIHVTGITPALSPSCDELIDDVLSAPRSPLVSFDVNHRPALWPDVATAADRLRTLADRADLVFVGRDEGERLWGTSDAEGIRALLPSPSSVIVKDDDIEAVAFVRADGERDTIHRVPALSVRVVETVGAGDAFAAGYLASWLERTDVVQALRSGHLSAGLALLSASDVPTPLDPREFDRLRRLDDDGWKAVRLPLPLPTDERETE